MRKRWVVAGAFAGLLGVALGAFGAHALEGVASADELAWWRTAVLYHLVHALALLATGFLPAAGRLREAAGIAFAAGTVVFSGSLYALGLGAPRALGAVTPVGGLALLVGWLLLALAALRAPPGRE